MRAHLLITSLKINILGCCLKIVCSQVIPLNGSVLYEIEHQLRIGSQRVACVSKQKNICHSREVIYIPVAQGGNCRVYGNSKSNKCRVLSLGHTVSTTVQCKQPRLSQDCVLDCLWGLQIRGKRGLGETRLGQHGMI